MKKALQLLFVISVMSSSIALGSTSKTSRLLAVGEQQIAAEVQDNTITNAAALQWYLQTTLRLGSSAYNCAVFPFQLPVLAEGEEISTASFSSYLISRTAALSIEADLYGIPYNASASVVAGHYFGGAYDSDPNATALQQGFFDSSSDTGTYTSSASANTTLAAFLNEQYANGAVGGEYVFLRINMNASSGADYVYLTLASQDNATAANRPLLTVNVQLAGASNIAPVVSAISAQSVEEESMLDVAISATDADGDDITLSGSSLPSFAALTDNGDGTGTLAIEPADGDAGTYSDITITANDGSEDGFITFDLTVTEPVGNQAPELTAIGDRSVYAGSTLTINLSATDVDGDDLTLSATNLPAFALLTDNGDGTGFISGATTTDDIASYNAIVVSVSDGELDDEETITVTVNAVPAGMDYYLDPVNGSMANDGSQANPWASLASVVFTEPTIAEGSTLHLLDGDHGTPYIQNYTFAYGITVTPLAGHSPTVTSISLNNCTNWNFDGVMIDGTNSVITKDGFLVTGDEDSDHITFSNCTIQSAASSSTWTKTDWYNNVKGGIDMRANHITIDNTTIKNTYHALSLRGDYATATNNLIDNFAGDAIRGLGSFSTYEYNTVRDCYIDDYDIQHDDGFQAYNLDGDDPKVEGVTLRYNKFLLFEDPITQFVIDNDLIGTLMQGVIITDGYADGWVVENNLIINQQLHGISLYGARNCKVQNNTVVQHPYYTDTDVPRVYLDRQGKTGQENFSNIIRNNISGMITTWTFDETSTVENNIDIDQSVYANYSTYFADYANMDFRLKSGSAAVDAGSNTGVTATDIEGNDRVSDGTVDVGAYEYSAAAGDNARPVLATIGNVQLDEEVSVVKNISATDADGDALTITVIGLPSFATFTDNEDGTAVLAVDPEAGDQGTYATTISVSDGVATDAEEFSIVINPLGGANEIPVLSTIANQNVEEGASATVNVTATDANGDALTLSATNLPSFVSFTDNEDGTGVIQIDPEAGDAGTYNVTISATDGTDTDDQIVVITAYQEGTPFGATYYVDPATGDNTNDGSQGSPWETLAGIVSNGVLESGDLVYLMDGHHGSPYVGNLAMTSNLYFKALDGHSPVIAKMTIDNSTYLVFDGLTIDASTAGLGRDEFMLTGNDNTNHITLNNCTLKSADDISTWTKTDWYANVTGGMDFRGGNITLDNNLITNVYHAVSLRGDHTLMSNNTIDNFAGDAIRGLGSFSTYEYNVVRDCYINDYDIQHDDGFQAYELTGDLKIESVTLRYNKFLLFEDEISAFVIDNELIGNLMQGIIITDGYADGWVVENNLVMNDQTHGITLYGGRNSRIQNNTVIQHPYYTDTDLVPWIAILAQGKTGQENFDNVIRNNIAGKYTTWTFDASSIVENNIDIDELDYDNYAPYFLDYAGRDFHLKEGSLAVDAGSVTDLAALDLDGNARSFGPVPDAGCYEYSAASDSNAPSIATTNNSYIDDVFTFSFSESVTPATAENIANYSINNGVTVQSATLGGDYRTITMEVSTLGGNQENTLTVTGVEDYAGNVISAGNTGTFQFDCDVLWASTYQDDEYGVNPPAGAMDDDLNTKWAANGEEWLQKNYCSVLTITSIEIAFGLGDERTYDFSVELSTDGVTYTEVFEGTSGGASLALENFDFTDTQARYVKIIGGGNSASTWNNYQEVKINTSEEVPANNAPIVASIEPQSVEEGGTLNIAVSATDDDNDVLILSASNLPSFATFTDNEDGTGNIAVVATDGDAGSYTEIMISANDGEDTHAITFDLTVTEPGANAAPVLASIGDQSVEEASVLNINASATDGDDDALTITVSNLPSFAVFTDNEDGTAVIAVSPQAGDAGTYANVEITVSDGEDDETESITITVTEAVEIIAIQGEASDREIHTDGTAIWTGQNTARIGGAHADYDAALIVPFELPEIPEGQEVSQASMSMYMAAKVNTPTGNVNLSGITSRDTNVVLIADLTASSSVLEIGFITSSTAAGVVSLENDQELADFINAQYTAGAEAGDFVYFKIESNIDETNYFYWTMATADDSDDSHKPTLSIVLGDKAAAENESISWNGATSSDWAVDTNWDGGVVPMASDDVTIPNVGISPNIGSAVSIAGLTLEDGAALTIATGYSLSLSGDLVASTGKLIVEDGASLLTFGTVSGAAHTFSRETAFNESTGRYSVIGSPVDNASTDVLGSLVYAYDESITFVNGNERFVKINTPETMEPGDAYFSAYTGTLDFTGTPNTGHVPVEIDHTGFNLISNPYPAAISYTGFDDENSDAYDGTIYLWDDGGSHLSRRTDSDYITANSMGSVANGTARSGNWNGHIGAMQGFIVNATADIAFVNDMKVADHNLSTTFFRASVDRGSFQTIKLNIKDNEERKSEMIIGYADHATEGVDKGMDAPENGVSPLKLYSTIGADHFAIQAVPFSAEQTRVMKLGFEVKALGQYTIQLQETNNWFEDQKVVLVDHYLGIQKELTLAEPAYPFEANKLTALDRFTIEFVPLQVLSAEGSSSLPDFKTKILGVSLFNTAHAPSTVTILDMSGKRLLQKSGFITEVPFAFKRNKIYVIQLLTSEGVVVRKVIIN